MTLFQKMCLILGIAVVAILTYDRINSRLHEKATKAATEWKDMHNAYDRCVASNDDAYFRDGGNTVGEGRRKLWLRARAYCRVNFGESLEQIGKDLDAVGIGR